MTKKSCILVRLCLLFAGGLLAGGAKLSGPVAGFVFDQSVRGIRPIVGIPGSSYLGDAVVYDLDWASASPNGNIALGVNNGSLYVIRKFDSPDREWLKVEGGLNQPEFAGWSRGGSSVVISFGNRVQWIGALTGNPEIRGEIDLPEGGKILAIASDANGKQAVVAAEAGVFVVSANVAPRQIAGISQPKAMALSNNGRDLFVADASSRQILQVHDVFGDAALTPFAAFESEAAGLAVSRDGKCLVAAVKSANTLAVFDLETGAVGAPVQLDEQPEVFQAVADGAFLLKGLGDPKQPLFVLDTNHGPAVYFIPAGKGE